MAKSVKVSRPHNSTAESARQKLRALAGEIETRYGLTVTWKGEVAHVSGRGVKAGTASVDAKNVTVDLSLGMPASLVASKIEAGIEKAISEQFA